MKAYVNGKMMAKQTGMKLASKGMKVDSMMWDNFFGGSSDMAAKKTEVRPHPQPHNAHIRAG